MPAVGPGQREGAGIADHDAGPLDPDGALAAQFGIAQHVPDWQSGTAQLQQKGDPEQVFLAEAPMLVVFAPDRIKQTDVFVIAQGMHRQTGGEGSLLDTQGSGHGNRV